MWKPRTSRRRERCAASRQLLQRDDRTRAGLLRAVSSVLQVQEPEARCPRRLEPAGLDGAAGFRRSHGVLRVWAASAFANRVEIPVGCDPVEPGAQRCPLLEAVEPHQAQSVSWTRDPRRPARSRVAGSNAAGAHARNGSTSVANARCSSPALAFSRSTVIASMTPGPSETRSSCHVSQHVTSTEPRIGDELMDDRPLQESGHETRTVIVRGLPRPVLVF